MIKAAIIGKGHKIKPRTLTCAILLCLTPSATIAADSALQSCPSRASQSDIDRFFAQRAADILRAGGTEDRTSLANLVAPTANYDIQNGDNILVSRKPGTDAIIDLTRFMRLTHYQVQSTFHGPLVVDPLNCTWEVTLLFPAGEDKLSMQMTFSFTDGILTKVKGNSVEIFEGNVR